MGKFDGPGLHHRLTTWGINLMIEGERREGLDVGAVHAFATETVRSIPRDPTSTQCDRERASDALKRLRGRLEGHTTPFVLSEISRAIAAFDSGATGRSKLRGGG